MLLNLLIITCLISLPLPSTGRNQHVKKHTGFHQPKKENVDLNKPDHRHKQKDWKEEDVDDSKFRHVVENHHTNKYSSRHGVRDRRRITDLQNKHHSAHGHQNVLKLNQSDHQRNDPSHGKTHKSGHRKMDSSDEKVLREKTDRSHNSEHVHHRTSSKGKSHHHASHHKSIDNKSNNNIKKKLHHQTRSDLNINQKQDSDFKREQKNEDIGQSSGKKRRSVGVENIIDNEFQSSPFEYPVLMDYPVSNEDNYNSNYVTSEKPMIEKEYDNMKNMLKDNGRSWGELRRIIRPNEGQFSNPVTWEIFFKEIKRNIDRVIELKKSHHKRKSASSRDNLDRSDQYNNNKDYNYYDNIGSKNKLSEVIVKPIYFEEKNDLKNKGLPSFPKAFEEESMSEYEKMVEEQVKESVNSDGKREGKYLQHHHGKPTSDHHSAGPVSSGNKKHHHHSSHNWGHRPNPYYDTGFPSLGDFRPNHHSHGCPFASAHSPSHHHSTTCKHKHNNHHTLSADNEKNNTVLTSSHDDNPGTESHDKETSTHPLKELFKPVHNFTTTLPPPHQYAIHETPDESSSTSPYQTPLNSSHHVHINHEIHKHKNASSSSPIYFPKEEITETKQEIINNPENKLNKDLKTNRDICKNGGSIQIPLLNINLPCGDVSVRGGHPDDFYKREFAISMTNVFHDYIKKHKQEEPLDIDTRIGRRRREVKSNFQNESEESEENETEANDREVAKNTNVSDEIVKVHNDLPKNDTLQHSDQPMLSEHFIEAVNSLDESSLVEVLKTLKDDYLSKSPGDEKTIDEVYQILVSSLLDYKRSHGETDRRRRESPRKARAEAAAILELLAATDGNRMETEQQDEPYYQQDYNQLDGGPDSSENPSFLELVSLADKHKSKA